ncbi:MAG: GGDEF domain-containing protein [Deltaproteobacteria bacterium]|nr:GGDEF domain-containing protein [Deltaproteobacteria bacterium]MBW2531206.1 GGDEF domain-containing protein [Deltaproteobacteria bacterium]
MPGSVRVVPLLDSGGAVVGAAEIFTDRSEQQAATHRIADLERMAFLDPLTRVANRRFLEQHLDARLHELQRFEWPFGVLMFDIDHFKRINDSLGHATGDHVLAMVARTAAGNARSFDLIARWGGDEFVHVVSNVGPAELRDVAWRLRNLVRNSALITDDQTLAVTVSVGAAAARRTDTIETLLERADAQVYRSKRAGRDCVHCLQDP